MCHAALRFHPTPCQIVVRPVADHRCCCLHSPSTLTDSALCTSIYLSIVTLISDICCISADTHSASTHLLHSELLCLLLQSQGKLLAGRRQLLCSQTSSFMGLPASSGSSGFVLLQQTSQACWTART